jgi:hypothetical protein
VVGARDGSAVSQWENATAVPNGQGRERRGEPASILGSRGALVSPRLPGAAGTRDGWRTDGSPEALRRRYVERDGEWAHVLA